VQQPNTVFGGAIVACLTISEVAKETGLKPPTIRKKIANGEIDVVRFGRAVRIPEESVRKLIARNTIPARQQ
jgi:excisionase family DNA binding protein